MSGMFKKMLVPLDGSENALFALDAAVSVARVTSAEILLFHSAEVSAYPTLPGDWVGWSGTMNLMQDSVKIVKERGRRILSSGEKRVEEQKLHAQSIMTFGPPVASICEAAEKENVDLIVMGSRGLSDFKGMFLGSVSHAVLQRCRCPVLLVKEPQDRGSERKKVSAAAKSA